MTINKPKFFQQISSKCGYIGEEMTGKIYYSLLKLILEELGDKKTIYLPDWGRFKVVDHPGGIRHHPRTRKFKQIPPYKCLVFLPCQKLKKYVNGRL